MALCPKQNCGDISLNIQNFSASLNPSVWFAFLLCIRCLLNCFLNLRSHSFLIRSSFLRAGKKLWREGSKTKEVKRLVPSRLLFPPSSCILASISMANFSNTWNKRLISWRSGGDKRWKEWRWISTSNVYLKEPHSSIKAMACFLRSSFVVLCFKISLNLLDKT